MEILVGKFPFFSILDTLHLLISPKDMMEMPLYCTNQKLDLMSLLYGNRRDHQSY